MKLITGRQGKLEIACASSNPPTKCQKKFKVQDADHTWQYPVLSTNMDIEDPSTINRHQAAITEELPKSKP